MDEGGLVIAREARMRTKGKRVLGEGDYRRQAKATRERCG